MIFDHMGLVVRNLDQGESSVRDILPIVARTARFDDELLNVSVRFLKDRSGAVFELISPYGAGSPVEKIAASRAGVINQIAYRVPDLASAAQAFRSKGAVPIAVPKPAVAFGGAKVQFFLTSEAFIVELIEASNFSHQFEEIG